MLFTNKEYLVGVVTERDEDDDGFVTEGKLYPITKEEGNYYIIDDDSGFRNRLSKNKYDKNFYKKWFVYIGDITNKI